MAIDCCRLVGDLKLNLDGCVISVSSSARAEIIKECGETLLVGPTTGTVSMTAYAVTPTQQDVGVHVGCPGQANVSVQWVRRYDCDSNIVYFIPAGQGASYVSGDVAGLASLVKSTGRVYTTINASAGSGPSSLYSWTQQEDGYGLVYTGQPISFNTDTGSLVFENFIESGGPALYLQSFSLSTNPGEIPTASYSFVFSITD